MRHLQSMNATETVYHRGHTHKGARDFVSEELSGVPGNKSFSSTHPHFHEERNFIFEEKSCRFAHHLCNSSDISSRLALQEGRRLRVEPRGFLQAASCLNYLSENCFICNELEYIAIQICLQAAAPCFLIKSVNRFSQQIFVFPAVTFRRRWGGVSSINCFGQRKTLRNNRPAPREVGRSLDEPKFSQLPRKKNAQPTAGK